MRHRRLFRGLLIAALLCGGCGGSPPRDQGQPTKHQALDRSARLAFDQGQYAQAATLYETVLQAAQAEDAPGAIVDARFNLALCQTNLGQYQAALRQIELAEAERTRRHLPADPDLQLLAGTAHYRSGKLEDAQRALQTVLRDGAASEATWDKAHFVAGLMAADRADASGLRKHISALGTAASGAAEADVLELQGRLLDLEGNVDGALLRLDQAAMQRSRERDYRGMVRALATAGDLAERAGRVGLAANYLLRAGRSAAQGSGPEAAEWLQRARALGERSGDRALVVEAEALLDKIEAGP